MKKGFIFIVVLLLLVMLVPGCAQEGERVPTLPDEEASPSTSEPIPAPEDANFRLLISDDVNAIGDFESLVVTVSSVGVHQTGEAGGWIDMPTAVEVDLVLLQGENAEEVWSGTLPDGEYNRVFVYVSNIDAVLNTGDSTEVKLPSDKLHINTHFSASEDSPVSFVFDISVVSAGNGNGQGGIKYILKPVINQSGPNQKFVEVSSQERDMEREREREQERECEEELDLELEGDIAPGETVTLLVTFEGEPVAGAVVKVNDEEIGNTGDDGTISFTIPEDAEGLEIDAELGEQEGELEIEFPEAEAE